MYFVGCLHLIDNGDTPRFGPLAEDYVIHRTRVVAIRTTPALAVAGEPRTVETLVLSPYEVKRIEVEVCGLKLDMSSTVVDMRCFEDTPSVELMGQGDVFEWTPKEAHYEGCVPWEAPMDEYPGAWCVSAVPILATVVDSKGEVALGGSHISVPDRPVPEDLGPEPFYFNVGRTDPSLPVDLLATGEAAPGEQISLEVRFEEPNYRLITWWIDAGELTQSGRTVANGDHKNPNEVFSSFNELIIPKNYHGPLTVTVVLQDSLIQHDQGGGGFVDDDVTPDDTFTNLSQPAWAQLTLEVK